METRDEKKMDDTIDSGAGEPRFFLDKVADFFKKMTIGVFKFAFWELPRFIGRWLFNWKRWKDIFLFLKRAARAIFWMTLWFVLAFAAWIAFDLSTFIWVWTSIGSFLWNVVVGVWHFTVEWFNVIWTIIALLGSMYGIAYVTLKKRAIKQDREFRGVFKRSRSKCDAESSDDDEKLQEENLTRGNM